MVKQYTQKQYNSAKERAYKKGFKDGQQEEQLNIAWEENDDFLESAEQVKSWNKYGEGIKIDWFIILMGILALAILVSMVTYKV